MTTSAVVAVLCWLPAAGTGPEGPPVRLYLPRSVQVTGEQLRLADVAVVLCEDAALQRKVRAIAMGRAPWPKERIRIQRQTVLSRLAGCGVRASGVRLTGAPEVAVMRQETLVRSERLLAAAEAFLNKVQPAGDGCIYRVVREPQEIVVSGSGDVTFACELARGAADGRAQVVVQVLRGERQVGRREVLFRRMYAVRRAVVVRAVEAGTVLTAKNVETQTTYAPQRPTRPWQSPFGRLATRRLRPGTVLAPHLTAAKKPDLVIRRNQTVRMRVRGLGFLITGLGQALQDGRPGEFIKVRNVDSKRVIVARVAFDGAVEPIFKR
jgi:flagella basal body P-ring formation protein FlgA